MLIAALAIVAVNEQSQQQGIGQNFEYLIRPYVGYITFGIDIAAGIIIAISAATALIAFFRILRKSPKEQTQEKETIRLRLARGLLLALDFEVGSDILKTILVPSVNELSILAVVVGIRIVLSWSLSKEIDRHNVDLVESGKQPIAGETEKTILEKKKNNFSNNNRHKKQSQSNLHSNNTNNDDNDNSLPAAG
jgi:uncharacterized membrane protein